MLRADYVQRSPSNWGDYTVQRINFYEHPISPIVSFLVLAKFSGNLSFKSKAITQLLCEEFDLWGVDFVVAGPMCST